MSNMQSVTSSNIQAAGYDPESQVLTVHFKNGSRYRYRNVQPQKWAEFSATFDGRDGRSAGRYFAVHIKPLPFERIEE